MLPTSRSDAMVLRSAFRSLLDRLHDLADAHDSAILERVRNSPEIKTATSQQRSVMLKDALLPISREVGRFLYGLARSTAAECIVEFGSSYGVSTLYFAAALSDNGHGRVIGTEMESSKVAKARQHLREANLLSCAEIREGDAFDTLKDVAGPIDLLFLDGWKELYLDVLLSLRDRLRPGAVVLADDLDIAPDQLAGYLAYVREPQNGFLSATLPLGDGMEFSTCL